MPSSPKGVKRSSEEAGLDRPETGLDGPDAGDPGPQASAPEALADEPHEAEEGSNNPGPQASALEAGDEADEADEGDNGTGGPRRVKRKFAVVVGFLGFGFRGLQINYEIENTPGGKKSVEHVIREAMVRAGLVTALNAERLEQKINWSRSSRTDAGVSAARLIISAKLLVHEEDVDGDGRCQSLVDELNRELPEEIRCFGAVKVPRSFDAKRVCSWREYEYLLPTEMARTPETGQASNAEDAARELRRVLSHFEGCNSYHNFTRLKAADLEWRSTSSANVGASDGAKEGDGAGGSEDKGGGRQSKGRGGKKGKKGGKGNKKGMKGSSKGGGKGGGGGAGEEADDAVPEDGGLPIDGSDAEGDTPASAAPQTGDQAATPIPTWAEFCTKDPTTGAWRERSDLVLKHTQSTIWMIDVEPAIDAAFLRIRLRGQFFLYNQIRLMVGAAAAVCSGHMPEELLALALRLRIEMHMPLAPALGLFLRTSGFTTLDSRAGFVAMDSEQAELCMLPPSGFVLLDTAGTERAEAFGVKVEAEVARRWREGGDVAAWWQKLRDVRVPPEAVLAELRNRRAKDAAQEAEAVAHQLKGDLRRRQDKLDSGHSFAGLMPRRFATDFMVRFRLVPGWRASNAQHALAQRLRQWEKVPQERPPGLSSPPETSELLDYVASVGVEVLACEGNRDR